jgi:putative toxin-antitoxin system antitoxin component (TIGR02293 family)
MKTPKRYKSAKAKTAVVNERAANYVVASHANAFDHRLKGLLDHSDAVSQEMDLIQLVRKGISKKSLDHLISQIGYTITDIASVLHVSDRNLRRYEPGEKLNTEQSERLVEIAGLYAKGEDVFGSIDSFNQWMNAEILALGNQTPRSFLDTSIGIRMLMKELGRIEHGIFA